jgi:xanthine dehydrogenase accessory factor
MEDIFEEIVKVKSEGQGAALATIIAVNGSTPREEGKMLIKSDGTIIGTIGGGRVEAGVCEGAKRVISEGKSKLLHFDLTGKETAVGICGGVMDVFVEPILSPPTLYIFGAGHISFSIAKIGKMVGFRVVVIDDRAEFANPERFPEADEILAQDFPAASRSLKINKSSYIVIVTRGHLSDEVVLEWAVGTEAGYIGMIGSRKKTDTVFSHLQSKGVPEEKLERVHSPIGLDICAETPGEIAVSILGEIIKVRREKEKDRSRRTCAA